MDAPRTRVLRFLVGIGLTALAASIIVEASLLPRATFLGMSEQQDRVRVVRPDGPAARAGIQPGDRILSIDGLPYTSLSADAYPLRAGRPGEPMTLRIRRDHAVIETVLVPDPLSPAEVAWNLAQAAAALLTLFVGSVVFLRRVRQLTFVFLLICLALTHMLFFPYVPPFPAANVFTNTGRLALNAVVPALFVHFFLLFPYERPILHKRPGLLAWLYAPSGVMFVLALGVFVLPLGDAVGEGMATISELLMTLMVVGSFGTSVALFVHAYRRTMVPSIRRKLRVALLGTAAGVLPVAAVALIHAFVPGIDIPVDRLAALGVVLLPVGFGYAILKHGIFDVEAIVKKGLVISSITGTLVLLYFLSYFLLRAILHTVTDLSGTLVSVLAFLFVILLFSPLREHVQDLVDRAVYPDRFASRRRLREFARTLPFLLEPHQIIESSLQNVARTLGVERGAYFPEESVDGGAAFTWGIPRTERRPIRLSTEVRELLFRRGEPMLREDVESDLPLGRLQGEDEACAELLRAAMYLPVDTGAHRFGVAAFGGRIDGETYSSSDLEVLGLLVSQTALAMENARFQKELRSKQEIERELEIAKRLQRQLLPHTSPEIPGVELTAAMLPCHEVGGDYFDYLWHDGRRLSFAIGDVSGKGIPAAILMANVQAMFRAEADDARMPDQVLARMNKRILEIEQPDRFVSFFTGLFDPATRELQYSNAGHPPPVWIRADGTVDSLEEGGLLLGIQPGIDYPLGRVWLRPGDVILCFTDGIEDPDANGSALREDELLALARQHRDLTVDEILDRILERIRAGGPLQDDTTVLVLKCLQSPSRGRGAAFSPSSS